MVIALKIVSLAIMAVLSITNVSSSQDDACIMMWGDTTCDLQIQGAAYHIETNGLMSVTRDERKCEVTIALPEYFVIDEVRYQMHDDSIVFIFGITDHEAGSAIIARFDPITCLLKWSTETHAFNTSPLLISDNFIYVGGIGMVAKLRLDDGKVLWQHKDLYEGETQSFNAFVVPRKNGNTIIFREDTHLPKKEIREVRVDDTTGVMLSR